MPYISIASIDIRMTDMLLVVLSVTTFFRCLYLISEPSSSTLYLDKKLFVLLVCIIFTQFWPLFGNITLIHNDYSVPLVNILVPIRRLDLIIVVIAQYVFLKRAEWKKVRFGILKGIIHGGLITSAWMILEHFLWIFFKYPINRKLFRHMMGLEPGHTFLNLIQISNGSILRATGLSWSPGLVGPPLLMIAILYLFLPVEYVGEKKMWAGTLLLLSPILSLSRTAIFGMVISTVVAIFVISASAAIRKEESLLYTIYSEKILKLAFFLSVIATTCSIVIGFYLISSGAANGFASFFSNTFKNPSEGTIRHVGYIIAVPTILTHDVFSGLFGYGIYTTGAGVEIGALWIPGAERLAQRYNGHWRVEPQIISILIAGGIPAALLFLYSYITTSIESLSNIFRISSQPQEVKKSACSLIFLSSTFILGLGYGVGGTFFFVILLLILFWTWE